MEVINDLKTITPLKKSTALAIGNFDGIHLGHQKILKLLQKESRKLGLLPAVLTFSPHPEKVLGNKPIKMIQTLEQRLEEISKYGIELAIVATFDKSFALLSAEEFILETVAKTLSARVVVIGEDFRFGRDREGDISLFKSLSSTLNFKLHVVSSVKKNGTVISSSLIRTLLEEGEVEKANFFLGRAYRIDGKVIKGSSRGRSIGFPTANIESENEILPPGVFLTTAQIRGKQFSSLTNVGECPTFDKTGIRVETHLLDFDRILYGEKIRIVFLKKIRKEIEFKDTEALKAQISEDIKKARAFFHRHQEK